METQPVIASPKGEAISLVVLGIAHLHLRQVQVSSGWVSIRRTSTAYSTTSSPPLDLGYYLCRQGLNKSKHSSRRKA